MSLSMNIEQILIGGFSLLGVIIGFFLSKFYTQVEKMVIDISQIKTNQASIITRLDYVEKQQDFLKKFITPKNYEMANHNKEPQD